MRSADWKVIGSIGIILGVIFLAGSFFAYTYTERLWGILIVAPYRDLTAPLIIAGIVLLVVGLICTQRAEEERKLEVQRIAETKMKFCPHCGQALPLDAKYCTRCGKALD